MNAVLPRVIILAVGLLFSTQKMAAQHETVLQERIHIEDSIHYSVPGISRLCDQTKTLKNHIDIGDCALFVEIEGEGVPLVLINGGPGGTHHYFHPWFSQIRESHKIIYYDQRGTGLSDFKAGSGYSFRQAVDDLEKLRVQLGISQWIICGFSYGGGLAQFYTAAYPENVLGLVLISSLPIFESDHFVSDQERHLSGPEKEMQSRLRKEYVNGNLKMDAFLYNLALNGDWKRQNYYKPEREEMVRSALYEWVNDTDFNTVMSADYNRYNLQGVFDYCPIPTIIFEGKNDLTWGSKKALVFKENHPNAKFILFENAAHKIFKDVPEEFYSFLQEFTISLMPLSADMIRHWKAQTAGMLHPERSE